MALAPVSAPWRRHVVQGVLRWDPCCRHSAHAGRLTNVATQESIGVGRPGELWSLAFEDGEGFVDREDGDDDAPLLVSELLQKLCWVRGPGDAPELGVQEHEHAVTMPIRKLYEERRDLLVRLHHGMAAAYIELKCTIFVRLRFGYACFWDMAAIYSTLQLQQYNGHSYVWLNHQWPKFQRILQRWGWSAKHILARFCDDALDGRVPDPEGVAERRSGSTLLLLALCLTCAFSKPIAGGFRDAPARGAARQLLDSLVQAARLVGNDDWVIHLVGGARANRVGSRTPSRRRWCLVRRARCYCRRSGAFAGA